MEPLVYVLYDGPCALCQGVIRLLLRRPAVDRCRFVPLEAVKGTAAGERLAARLGEPLGDTVVVLVGSEIHVRSDAVLALLAAVGPASSLVPWFRRLPRAWRDRLYDAVASGRGWLFGRAEAPLCGLVPVGVRPLLLPALPEEAVPPAQPPGPK